MKAAHVEKRGNQFWGETERRPVNRRVNSFTLLGKWLLR